MRLLGILFLIILATACGGKNSNTTIKVSTSALFAGSAALQGISEGGLMLWGVSDNGNRFGKTLEDTDSISLDLPNGTWTFYAVAWDHTSSTGAELLASTGLKCAESVPTQLAGTQVNVALAVSAGTCANDIFRGYASSANSGTINAQLCENLTGVTAYNHVCSDDRITAGANWKSDKVPMMSVKVTLPNYLNNTDVPGGISRCMVMPSNQNGSWTNVTAMKLPIGDVANPAKSPFRLRLEFFPGNNACDDTGTVRGSITRILPNGLLSPISPIKTFHNSGQHYTFLSISDSEICNGRTAVYSDVSGARNFAGGAGTLGHPFLICSPQQLLSMHDLVNATTFNYRLSANIDLNPYSKGVTTATLPSDSDCWEDGQNWQPLGHAYAAPSACTASISGFTASFDGNDHSISNIRAKVEDANDVGFISRVSASSAQTLRDFVFINPELEGLSKVGTLFGNSTNSGAVKIDNIKIINPNIRARSNAGTSYVGALFGIGMNLNLKTIQVQGGKVSGDGSYVAGVFGYLTNGYNLTYVSARTTVQSNSYAATTNIGGVGGYFDGSSLAAVGKISHEGIITTGGSKVGGIFGQLGSMTVPLNDFYAKSAISTLDTGDNQVGGIIGFNSHVGAINNGFFAGHISDSCLSGCHRGIFIGDVTGGTPGASGNLYYLSDNQPTVGGSGGTDLGATGYANTNNIGLYATGTLTFFETDPWVHVPGDIPRLIFEQHPCSGSGNQASIATQSGTGRGSSSNPLIVCTKEQLGAIGSLSSGKYVSIAGAVNMTGTFTPPNIGTGVTVNGNGNALFGYIKSGSVGSEHWAVFNEIAGTFKNTDLANIILQMSVATGASSVSGVTKKVFPSGIIEDVSVISSVLSHQDPADAVASGITKENNGTIRRTSFNGNITAESYLAGFAYLNSSSGTIQESETRGKIVVPAAGSYFYGFVGVNAGALSRNSVNSKLYSTSVLNHISQFVGINQGTISDVHVTNEALWSFSYGSNVAQLAVENDGLYSATITRALVEGEFLNTNLASSSVAVAATQQAKPVNTINAGVHQGVLAVPAGRKISMNSAAACATSTLNIPSSSISASAFNNASTYFVSSLAAASKIVWLRIESNGKSGYLRVTDAGNDDTNLTLTLENTCTSLGFTGTVNYTVIQDYDTTTSAALGSLTTSPWNGFISGASYIDDTSFVGPWRANLSGAPVSNFVFADTSSGGPVSHLDWIFGVYEAWLTQSAVPVAPLWELDDDEMDIFSLKK